MKLLRLRMADGDEVVDVEEKFDQVLALLPLARDLALLQRVSEALNVDSTVEVAAGDSRALYRKISSTLNAEAFTADAERGQKIETCFNILIERVGMPKLESSGDEMGGNETAASERQPDPQAGDAGKVTSFLSNMRLKEFKFDGQVGYPGEKGKLDFSGVMHNINMAKKRGFPPEEICFAAIRAIVPGHPTRTYLEGDEDINLDKIIAAFRSHFQQDDVTDTYNKMTLSTQGTGDRDTAYTFVASMLGIRNEINGLCRNKHVSGTKYGPDLVQSAMQKAIYNGLRDEDIRQDLKHLLKRRNVEDSELLAAVSDAMSSKRAHEERMKELESKQVKSKTQKVTVKSLVASDDDDDDSQSKSGQSRRSRRGGKSKAKGSSTSHSSSPDNDVLMAQLASVIGSEIRGAVEPLQAQINDLNQRSYFPSPGMQGQQKNPLNPKAQPFQNQKNANSKSNGGQNGTSAAPTPVANGGAGPCSDQFLAQLFQQVFGNGGNNMPASRGTASGGPSHSQYNGVFLQAKCSNCRNAGALFCNHCQICHKVDHRNINCPKRADPTWKPLN